MTPRHRYVLDTNVLVSALAFARSKPRKAFDLALDHGVILASGDTLLELSRTLRKPRLSEYFTRLEQEAFLTTFVRQADFVEVTERISLCRDPQDDRFLEVAAAGRASHLITGDRDLLELDPFRGTRIITPAALLAHFKAR